MSVDPCQEANAEPGVPSPVRGWKYWGLNALLVMHLLALALMVAGSGSGAFSSPPLLARAASYTAPYVRFTGMQNGYRFFAPDPGSPTVLWSRLVYEDESVRWMESPGRESHHRSLAYHRDLYPAMILGMQTAPSGMPVAEGYPHLTDMGLTYATSYARHLAEVGKRRGEDGIVRQVRTVEIFVVTHAIRTPAQVRQGWEAYDLRLYRATALGEFSPDGTLAGKAAAVGHVKPPILEVAERMYRDATSPHADVAGPDLPAPLRVLLTQYHELRDTSDPRPLRDRIGAAVVRRDLPEPSTPP